MPGHPGHPGHPGNPNHDPKTGKFASASGLNVSNSTLGQRGKARIKEHIGLIKDVAIGVAGATAAGIGMAVLHGITTPVRHHTTVLTNKGIKAGLDAAAAHGPTVAKAIKAGGSALINHVKNMKNAGAIQHKPMPAARRGRTTTIPGKFPWK